MSSREYILRLEMRTLETEVENERLRRENEILRNRLRFYENPNTPPSQLTLKKKFRDERVEKKGGAPKGHRGATRKKREPDEVIQLSTECRPYCSHELGEPIRTETRIIEDLPPPSKIKVTQFDIDVYGSPNCGAEVKGKHRDCPQVGGFGIYLLVYMTMLKYHLRGPLRKVRDFLCYNDSFEISPKGVRDGLLRVGDACKNEYGELIQRIRNSRWVHVDETGMKVNGEKWWLWIFRTDKADVLTVIRKSGGKNVPQEILGEHKGVMIADDWRAYNRFVLQRCWAHLIREVDDFKAQSKEGERLSADIHLKFEELKELLGKGPPIDERELMKIRLDMGMEELVERHSAYKEIEEPVTYIRNGLSSWYTCLLYPGMEPTNNLGEQALREHVIMRKIIGTFRSENGSVNYQYIASMLAAWKLQGKNPFEELESLLRKELCLK
jgi:transposase